MRKPTQSGNCPYPSREDILAKRDADILNRFYALHGMYNKWDHPARKATYISLPLLRNCVESYYIDTERLKVFHDIHWTDRHKLAGFTIKWINAIRPIQRLAGYDRLSVEDGKALTLGNESFAFWAGTYHLDADKKQLSPRYYRNFVYSLRYRPMSGEVLASKMSLLERALNRQTPWPYLPAPTGLMNMTWTLSELAGRATFTCFAAEENILSTKLVSSGGPSNTGRSSETSHNCLSTSKASSMPPSPSMRPSTCA